MSIFSRAWLLTAAQVVVTAAALSLIFAFAGGRQILRSFAGISLPWLGLGLACVILQTYWLALRWRVICNVLSPQAPGVFTLFHQIGRSMIYAQLLPSSLAADAVRTVGTAKAMSVRDALRSVICDRLVGLASLIGCCLIALAMVAQRIGLRMEMPLHVKPLALVAVICAIASAFVGWGLVRRLALVGRVVAMVQHDVVALWKNPAALRRTLALAFAAQLAAIVSFAAFVEAMSAGTSVWSAMLVLPFAQAVTLLPITVGGWGIREGAVAFSFAQLGADPVVGITASVLFGLSGPAIGALIEIVHAASHLRSPGLKSLASPHGPGLTSSPGERNNIC